VTILVPFSPPTSHFHNEKTQSYNLKNVRIPNNKNDEKKVYMGMMLKKFSIQQVLSSYFLLFCYPYIFITCTSLIFE